MSQRYYDIKTLDLKVENKELSNEELTNFKIFKMHKGLTRGELVQNLSSAMEWYGIENQYYCMKEYIEDFIFVQVWSGRFSATYTMNMIANYTSHKLKNIIDLERDSIWLVFKKREECKEW